MDKREHLNGGEGVFLSVCAHWIAADPPATSHALPLNPIRKLIGKLWVLGSGLRPTWLMGLPDLKSLINDSRNPPMSKASLPMSPFVRLLLLLALAVC